MLISSAFLLPCDLQLDSLGATLIRISNDEHYHPFAAADVVLFGLFGIKLVVPNAFS